MKRPHLELSSIAVFLSNKSQIFSKYLLHFFSHQCIIRYYAIERMVIQLSTACVRIWANKICSFWIYGYNVCSSTQYVNDQLALLRFTVCIVCWWLQYVGTFRSNANFLFDFN